LLPRDASGCLGMPLTDDEQLVPSPSHSQLLVPQPTHGLPHARYPDAEWRREWDAETLFLQSQRGVGLLVQPRPGRAVLMHQEVLHRVSTPSLLAHRPRYSIVWKLVFVPRMAATAATAAAATSSTSRPSRGGGMGGGGGGAHGMAHSGASAGSLLAGGGGESILRAEWGEPLRL
jgi:hypothetical protein